MKQKEAIKVLSIFGTRPEAIKMAPLAIELNRNSLINHKICVTAQHRQMLDQVLKAFKIHPDYDLNIMKDKQDLGLILTNVLAGVSNVLMEFKPDVVLVHGDTSTTFAAALASFYQKINVGHVEAGLRTNNKYSPFPEEMNRRLTSQIASLHFAPTSSNKEFLFKENIRENIFITGNTVIDALNYTVSSTYEFENEELRNLNLDGSRLIVLTAHRRENLGAPLQNICNAIRKLVDDYQDLLVVYPVHLNPVVRDTVFPILGGNSRIKLIDPVSVQDMHNLIAKAHLVLTDSGGLQEEAPSLGKPVLVLRTETERPEALKAGTVKIAGVQKEDIYRMTSNLLNNSNEYQKMAKAVNPYGDGHASERIVKAILYHYGMADRPEDFQSQSNYEEIKK